MQALASSWTRREMHGRASGRRVRCDRAHPLPDNCMARSELTAGAGLVTRDYSADGTDGLVQALDELIEKFATLESATAPVAEATMPTSPVSPTPVRDPLPRVPENVNGPPTCVPRGLSALPGSGCRRTVPVTVTAGPV